MKQRFLIAALGLMLALGFGPLALRAQTILQPDDADTGPLLPGADDGGAAVEGDPAAGGAIGGGRVTPPPPLPPPPPVGVQYFYMLDRTRMGPIELTDLKRLFADGTLDRSTLFWRNGLDNWTAAGDVAELGPLLVLVPPPPPPDNPWKKYMLGTWSWTNRKGLVGVESLDNYREGGKFSSIVTFSAPDPMGSGRMVRTNAVDIAGNWKTEPMVADQFKLTVTITYVSQPTPGINRRPNTFLMRKIDDWTVRNDTEGIEARKIQ